jgi:hypothetical protein
VKVLTKYQAEKEICSYHWEVVDGCNCCCPSACRCVYKPAPPETSVGDVLAVSPDEQAQLASYVSADGQSAVAASGEMLIPTMAPTGEPASAIQAAATSEPRQVSAATPKPPAWQRVATFWRSADEQK